MICVVGTAESGPALSLAYLYGIGVPKDTIEAYKWFKLALRQGHEAATKER